MHKAIILINSLKGGGAERVVSNLSRFLTTKRNDFILVCLEKNDSYTIDNLNRIYLSKLKGDENPFYKFINLFILAWRLKKIVRKEKIQVVQSHLNRSHYINIFSKVFGAKHTSQIVNTEAITTKYQTGRLLDKVNLFLIKKLFSKADLIIFKSKGMLNEMNKILKLKSKTRVINNPYYIDEIIKKSTERNNDFQFNPKKKYIITVGRLHPQKRQADIIHALKLVNQKHKDIELIILGEGHTNEKLQTLAREIGIDKKVHFLGWQKNPYQYLAQSDIFVLASECEGFPNVLVEAMICQLPVISADCHSGPREILAPKTNINFLLKDKVEYTEYGVLFPVGNVMLLAEAIVELINNASLKQSNIKKGLKRAKTFDAKKILKEYEHILFEE